jgi:hypothetical protein
MSLSGLWSVALLLAGTALLIMAGLIIARSVEEARARRHGDERRRLIPLLLGSDGDATSLPRSGKSNELLTDLAVELIQMVRGEERERLTQAAARAGVPHRLLRRLRSPSAQARISAVEALAAFRFQQTVSALYDALGDRNADVRMTAAMSLAAMGEAPPARELIDKLGIGTRENSLLTIGLFEDIAATRPQEVRAVIEDPTVPGLAKAAAIDSISASGDYSLVPVITRLALAADLGAGELPRYLQSLARFGHPAAIPAIKRALGSDAPPARAAACEAAGLVAVAELAGRLIELLDDPDWWVRFRAAEALTRLGTQGAALLGRTAREGSPVAARAAALTLAERGITA